MSSANILVSQSHLTKILSGFDPQDANRNILWTTDTSVELPIRVEESENLKLAPITLIELFQTAVKRYTHNAALSVKRGEHWVTLTYLEYLERVRAFANALVSLGVEMRKAVNIIGFNSPEWNIAFFGSVFAGCLPVGVYTTNQADSCRYVADHSDCEVVVVENQEHLTKYLGIWDSLPGLKAIIIYNDTRVPASAIPDHRLKQVFQWSRFLELGRQFRENHLEKRMMSQHPGHCCTLVYTSGTTGMPKGVMLSHDNYVWTAIESIERYRQGVEPERIVSYLPLSHVAAQIIDIVGSLYAGCHVFFATPDALQGALINTLREVRPTFFFSVPRVWEKIEEKMKQIARSNGLVKSSIAAWAKSLGKDHVQRQVKLQSTTISGKVAQLLVYDNVKRALGLDQARFLIFGAAPLAPAIRAYFLSLSMLLINAYGMSESSGPQTLSDPRLFNQLDDHFLTSAGNTLKGTRIKIVCPDQDGNGEICYTGRNRFMGYYKNEKATRETIDCDGFLHSGDIGRLDSKGNLQITGRLKELIITAGGENVAPVLIENSVKRELAIISNCMVVGDQRPYLGLLVALKQGEFQANELSEEVLSVFSAHSIPCKTIDEAKQSNEVRKLIDEGIERANSKAISRAQHIRKWVFLDEDFSEEAGDLTPTLKLKRSVVAQKYRHLIESLYASPKL